MNTEPVAIQGAIVVLVNSLVALLVLMDVFTDTVGAAVALILVNAVTLIGIIWARSKVTPTNVG